MAVSRAASVELRMQPQWNLGRAATEKVTVPVTLRDVSLGGLSLHASSFPQPPKSSGAQPASLDRGVNVSVKLQIGARTVTIPALVVWSRKMNQEEEGAAFTAGLQLHLQITDSTTRRQFETWIQEIERISAANGGAPVTRPATEATPAPASSKEAEKLFNDLFQ